MSTEKATALVVRGTDWSETSRIVTLFTRDFGKVRALAKGGRRLRSNFEVALDLLTVCHIVFIRKSSGGLDLLIEAQVAERFPSLRTNLPALYAGYYVAELLADGTQDYDPHPQLFDAALETLRELQSTSPLTMPLPDRISAFELVWLRELGYGPRLEACAGCERDLSGTLSPDVRLGFSPTAGGVICSHCLPTARDRRLVSGDALRALRGLNAGFAELSFPVRREVRQILGQTIASVLGRRPRLLGYVDGG